ncbi:MAG: hypothetical protein AABY15_09125 [Nanoarchaeota archaeon]
MGFVRGGLFVIFSVLFFISLLLANSLFVATSSLDYQNLKQELIPVVKQALNEQINITSFIEEEKYPLMQKFCANSSQELEYVFSEKNYTFTVPCSAITNGTQNAIDSAVDNLFYEYYYKEYNCNFFDCLQEDSIPFFLVSEHSKNYWSGKFYYSLLALAVLLAFMFVLIGKKTNLPLVAGSLIILSSLLFAKLESLAIWLINIASTSPINLDKYLKFFTLIFTQSYRVFLIMLIIGIAVLVLGIILKFFAIGLKINEFFSRFDSKKETDTEAKKKNKDESTRKNSSK